MADKTGLTRRVDVVREITQNHDKTQLKLSLETLVFVDGVLTEVIGGKQKNLVIVAVAM